jgi:hypothetical protein
VYTRILLPSRTNNEHLYKLILAENPMAERIVSFETSLSTITRDSRGTPVSKWRSFYIDVPEGENTYTITHWASPKDTILLRFTYESPQPWTIINATEYRPTLEAIEGGTTKRYYELLKGDIVVIQVPGPTRIRITTRLNYDETLFGEQSFTLMVNDNGNETTFPIKCNRSDALTYENRSDIVPSKSRSVYLSLEKGMHTIEFTATGTLAKSVAIRFEKEP